MDVAVDVAEQAAPLIMDVYKKDDFDIQIKSDRTPVTKADLLAHHLIKKRLQQHYPEIPILSEESASVDWQQRKHWQTYWLIDPLDGTKEFVDKNGEFTINIALIFEGRPIIGVVLAPALGLTYLAANGIGAYKKQNHQMRIPIQTRKAPKATQEKRLTLIIGRRSSSPSLNALYEKLPTFDLIRLGSSLKTCKIAEGKADLYPRFGNTSEWDTAAAQCILECAGGAVTDLKLLPLCYNTKESLLNPSFIAWGDETVAWTEYLE